jgi:hypothetical protein
MLTRCFSAIALLLPVVAIPVTTHAGSTISDKHYWPGEIRSAAPGGPRDALAFGTTTPLQPAAIVERPNAWRYRGGPKSRP